jgi:carbon-monoxide dehydrogenase small subunit
MALGDPLVCVRMTVNGKSVRRRVRAGASLLQFLREDLGLTGTKRGCDQGQCGACTVLVDGKAVNACLMLAAQAHGKAVTTIEGVAGPAGLHPIQEAFIQEGAVQCGFCTPGMILSAKALLDGNPCPTPAEIREALSGTLCRCSGYGAILRAVGRAAEAMAARAPLAREEGESHGP